MICEYYEAIGKGWPKNGPGLYSTETGEKGRESGG